MIGPFRSKDEAWRRFQEYSRLDPRIGELWSLCLRPTPPPKPEPTEDDDSDEDLDDYNEDEPPDEDPLAGWCAEHFFFATVKPRLLQLVGWRRRTGPVELRTDDAYDAVYSALLYHALAMICPCCRDERTNGDLYAR